MKNKTSWGRILFQLFFGAILGYLGMRVTYNGWAFFLFGYLGLALFEISSRLGQLDKKQAASLIPSMADEDNALNGDLANLKRLGKSRRTKKGRK
jgi:hypothetical protein